MKKSRHAIFTSLFSTAIYPVVYRYFFMNFSKRRTSTTVAYRKPVTGILTDKFKMTTVKKKKFNYYLQRETFSDTCTVFPENHDVR